jgi:hypothetical protein
VACSCEHGNESSGSIKCRKFLDLLYVFLARQEGFCSMEFFGGLVLQDELKCHIFPARVRIIIT